MAPSRISRRTALRLLGAYGLVLVALTLAQVLVGSTDLAHTLLGVGLLGGTAALLLVLTHRVARSDVDEDLLPGVLGWCLGGSAFLLALVLPALYYLGVPTTGRDAVFAYQLGASVGGLGGLLAGYHEARMVTGARETARTEAERERQEYLNHLLRHDVLNNLTVIDGNLGLVLDDPDGEDAIERLHTARRQAQAATEHIRNVRVLVQSARADQRLEPVDLAATADQELSHLRDVYPDAEVTADVPSVPVIADDLLGSVVENLVRNAVQHNDAETPRVTVEAEVDDGTVTLSVSDDGPGIPDAVLASLDDPPGPGDHGVGLHLVRTLVERYGGALAVPESTPEGTTVEVELRRT